MAWVLQNYPWLSNGPFVLGQAVGGVAQGMVLFTLAAGLSLVFGVTRVINFGHGAFAMAGAYITYTAAERAAAAAGTESVLYWASLVTGPLLVGAAAYLVDRLVLRRLRRAPQLFQLLATFGVTLVISDAVRLLWGAFQYVLPRPAALSATLPLAGGVLPAFYLPALLAGPAAALGLWYLIYRTGWGMLVRACSDDPDMAGAMGLDADRVFTMVFVLGSCLAGLGGVLQSFITAIHPSMDSTALIDAFVVVVVGGLGSFPGSLLSALLIGELKAFGILFIPRISLVLPFLFMAIMLMWRPWGLLGRAEPEV